MNKAIRIYETGGPEVLKWEDVQSEAVSFYYNKGSERKMDNYYDTIQLLSVHNINQYKPVKVSIEGLKIEIFEIFIVDFQNISIHHKNNYWN